MLIIRAACVLGSDPGVRIFSPQYPTRKGGVLGQLWYLPVSKRHDKNAEKFCGHWRFGVSVDTYSKPLCLWITSLVMQVFSGRLDPYFIFLKFPISDQYLIFHTRSSPGYNVSKSRISKKGKKSKRLLHTCHSIYFLSNNINF